MSALAVLAGIVLAYALLVVLRPGWALVGGLVAALLAGDRLGVPPLPIVVVAAGLWLLWRGAQLARGGRR